MASRRTRYDPDQYPLITPPSAWVAPDKLPDLVGIDTVALDTECLDLGLSSGRGPGWALGAGHVAGVSAAWREGSAVRKIYAPVRHPETACLPRESVARWLRDITRRCRVVMHNAPYDVGWLAADMDIASPTRVEDTTAMAVMIDENRRSYRLDDLCRSAGLPGKDETLLREAAAAYGYAPKDVKANVARLPARYVGPYAEQDAASTLLLWENMLPEIESQGLGDAYRLETDLIPMVHEMRRRGIRLDLPHLEHARDRLYARSAKVLAKLSEQLGTRVGIEEIRSNPWLVRAFETQSVEYERSESGGGTFERDWMRQGYAGQYDPERRGHWLPLLVAEARQCHEAASKFIQGYLLDFSHGGRVHASINQFRSSDEQGDGNRGTRTYRFSYDSPPLQQMPSRPEKFLAETWTLTEEIAREIRGGFLPEEGELWGAADYSQQEYRLIVSYAEMFGCTRADEAAEKYRRDPRTDFHQLVVDLTGLARRAAKDVNFAKSYGAGVQKFAAMTGMSPEEAEAKMTQYDTEMPFVSEASRHVQSLASRRGLNRLLDGARCHFDEWDAGWLSREDHALALSRHQRLEPCSLSEAQSRASETEHPWHGRRLRRAGTHKAFNKLIQGGAARQTKLAMRGCWGEGHVPLLQMHDELGFSFPRSAAGRREAERCAEIMRTCVPKLRVPMLVDMEVGRSWGDARHGWEEATRGRKKAS